MNKFENNKQLIYLDFYILNNCIDSILAGDFSYVDLVSKYTQIDENLRIFSNEDYKKRIYYMAGLGYIELEKINESEFKNKNTKSKREINQHNYYKFFINGRITSSGIRKFEELEIEIESNKGIMGIYKAGKEFFEKTMSYKYIVGLTLTGICAIMIFAFDIKVSAYISKMPILSSIINTETLEKFEEINANDDMYKEVQKELNIGTGSINNSEFKEIKVKKISQNESIFRVILNDGEEQLIPVKKNTDGKIKIELPPKIKVIQEKLRKNFPKLRN